MRLSLTNLVCVLFDPAIPTSSFNFIQLFLYLLTIRLACNKGNSSTVIWIVPLDTGANHGWTSQVVQDTLSILGVCGYSDTRSKHGWASMDGPGSPEYSRYTRILRHSGLIMGGRPRIVRDTLSILGVRGYSDTVG